VAGQHSFRIWGARGTVQTPNPAKLRFGGHTTCIAGAVGAADYVILDCGSGLRRMGAEAARLRGDTPTRYHLFLSHYHLDHLEGLPYFQPLYNGNSHLTFHGFDSGGRSTREILETYMAPPYFPVRLAEVPARLDYVKADGRSHTIHDVTVRQLPLTHPDGSLSYRLERGERSIVMATDHEHGDAATDQALVRFAHGADYLIYDATYIPSEYERLRRGWGHSTWYAAVQVALAAQVKTLVLFHHHPEYTDPELDEVCRVAREEFPDTVIASEGMELLL
jgi:phosphoribosyl 1,2-cyclic phosphodiesterase